MLSENYQVIDNYSLEDMVQIYPNSTQIWAVRHKVLKKRFTFKKLKFSSYSTKNEPATPTFNRPTASQYERLVSETNLLKKLNFPFAPKCYEIIKTNNNVYVVYEQFPSQTLKQYLDKQTLSCQQKNSLMQNLASAISQLCSKSIVMVGLNLENIFIKDNLEVVLGDWTLSRILGNHQKYCLTDIQFKSEFIANQIKEEGQQGVWSDIYSLGKIYKAILNYYHLENQNEDNLIIENMIQKMISNHYRDRPSIKEVVKTLREQFSEILTKSTHSWTFHEDETSTKQVPKSKCRVKQTLTIQIESLQELPQKTLKLVKSAKNFISQKQIERASSNQVQSQSTEKSTTPVETPREQFSKNKTSSQDITSLLRLTRAKSAQNLLARVGSCKLINIKQIDEEQKQVKKINNKRNLSFFIADLAEFVARTDLNKELGFMLMKYSLLSYKQTLQKWESMGKRTKQAISFTNIMKKEIENIEKLTNLFKQQFTNDEYKLSYAFKKQLEQSTTINDALMRIKMLQFAKEVLASCKKYDVEKTTSIKKIDVLFKTYLILKKVEEGNFQKFWKKVTNEDQLFLSNQKYLREEKNYGLRYIKSKISEIISKK